MLTKVAPCRANGEDGSFLNVAISNNDKDGRLVCDDYSVNKKDD